MELGIHVGIRYGIRGGKLWNLVDGRELGVDLGINFGSLLIRSSFFGVDL